MRKVERRSEDENEHEKRGRDGDGQKTNERNGGWVAPGLFFVPLGADGYDYVWLKVLG